MSRQEVSLFEQVHHWHTVIGVSLSWVWSQKRGRGDECRRGRTRGWVNDPSGAPLNLATITVVCCGLTAFSDSWRPHACTHTQREEHTHAHTHTHVCMITHICTHIYTHIILQAEAYRMNFLTHRYKKGRREGGREGERERENRRKKERESRRKKEREREREREKSDRQTIQRGNETDW